MNCTREQMRLYAVTDRAWTGAQTLYQQVEAALQGGVTCVQLREKQLDRDAFLQQARQLVPLCQAYGVPLLINDDVDIALACGADGVHIGQSDTAAREARRRLGPDKIVGVSCHSVAEALQAQADGADYLGVGAVFPTGTKTDAAPLPRPVLEAICRTVALPVVAIGGIHRDNLLQLAGSGVDGVALVSAIFAQPDITAACRGLRALSDQMVQL